MLTLKNMHGYPCMWHVCRGIVLVSAWYLCMITSKSQHRAGVHGGSTPVLVPEQGWKELKAITCLGMACLHHMGRYFLVSFVTCRHTPGPRSSYSQDPWPQGQDLADDKRGRPSFGKSHHLKQQENIKEYQMSLCLPLGFVSLPLIITKGR